jgi:hypothetical protein
MVHAGRATGPIGQILKEMGPSMNPLQEALTIQRERASDRQILVRLDTSPTMRSIERRSPDR